MYKMFFGCRFIFIPDTFPREAHITGRGDRNNIEKREKMENERENRVRYEPLQACIMHLTAVTLTAICKCLTLKPAICFPSSSCVSLHHQHVRGFMQISHILLSTHIFALYVATYMRTLKHNSDHTLERLHLKAVPENKD